MGENSIELTAPKLRILLKAIQSGVLDMKDYRDLNQKDITDEEIREELVRICQSLGACAGCKNKPQ